MDNNLAQVYWKSIMEPTKMQENAQSFPVSKCKKCLTECRTDEGEPYPEGVICFCSYECYCND